MTPSIRAILWRDLPLLNYALYSVGIAHAEITNLPTQRLDLVPTAVFPMLVPWVIYALRWKEAAPREKIVALLVSLLPPLFIALNYTTAHRVVLSHDSLRNIYEVVAILNTLFLMAHAYTQGASWLKLFLGPCLVYGMLLENGGIWLGYFSEMNYRLYLGPLPAPMATMSGWVTVFYIITWSTWELKKLSPRLRASVPLTTLVAVSAALCFDLQVDPLATEVGFWKWHPSLHQGWLGVPLLNYAAWTAAVIPFAWLIAKRESTHALATGEIASTPHRRWLFKRVPLALAVAAVLFLGMMTVIERGTSGPTFAILAKAFAF